MKTSGNRQISKPLHSEEYKLMVNFIRDICNIVKEQFNLTPVLHLMQVLILSMKMKLIIYLTK